MNHTEHSKIDTFEMEEQVNGNDIVTWNGSFNNGRYEEEQVCIYH
jgi:hypothetical protein